MKRNEDIYNSLNSKLYNQDNNGVWVNPILQDNTFKFFLIILYLGVGFLFFKNFNIENLSLPQIVFHSIYSVSVLMAILFLLKNKIKAKIFIEKQEKKFKKDLNISFDYYRDILKEFSPGVLAFCYNKNLKYEDIIIATLQKELKLAFF